MKQRVYLDTSVFSVLHDPRAPERMGLTRIFWESLSNCESLTSEVAKREIEDMPEGDRRRLMLASLALVPVVVLTPEMRELADRYVTAGIFTRRMHADSLHVAACVLARCDVLVSWNFRHLVNRRRRAEILAVNTAIGLPGVDIVSPPEF